MATYVLVHGAWHGGWCWDGVVPSLRKAGHDALAPDLPGMGADTTPRDRLSLEVWVQHIAGLIEQLSGPVILVGHSRGGIVISQIAEALGERISRLVYVTAFLIPDGASLIEVAGPIIEKTTMAEAITLEPDGSFAIAPDKAAALFFNLCTAEVARRAARQLCPEPAFAMTTPLRLTERFAGVPRAYIQCTRDAALPPAEQQKMYEAMPCDRVLTLPSDHSPFLSMPEVLAEQLLSLA